MQMSIRRNVIGSLGGGAHGMQDLLTMVVDNLDRANMVVAVASGNSGVSAVTGIGNSYLTVESPGSAARALTAGASTTVAVTMTAGKGAPKGGHQAYLEITDGATNLAHAALYTVVK